MRVSPSQLSRPTSGGFFGDQLTMRCPVNSVGIKQICISRPCERRQLGVRASFWRIRCVSTGDRAAGRRRSTYRQPCNHLTRVVLFERPSRHSDEVRTHTPHRSKTVGAELTSLQLDPTFLSTDRKVTRHRIVAMSVVFLSCFGVCRAAGSGVPDSGVTRIA